MRSIVLFADNDNDVDLHNLRLRDSADPIEDATITATLYEVLAEAGSASIGENTIESPHEFSSDDIGKAIVVGRAGTNGADLFSEVDEVTAGVAELADEFASDTDYAHLSLSVDGYRDVQMTHVADGTYRVTILSGAGLVTSRAYWLHVQIESDGGSGAFRTHISVVSRE